MGTKITQRATSKADVVKPVDEVILHNREVSLCLLFHRQARTMRIVDFRAGPNEKKREAVLELAQKEGVEKIFTLVERDEVATWVKLGFQKEATIPGFYKRSDAYLVGSPTDVAAKAPMFAHQGEDWGTTSDDDDLDAVEVRTNELAEKTLVRAKRRTKDVRGVSPVKVTEIGEEQAHKALTTARKTGSALTAFEPFGRDVTRRYYSLTLKSFELIASVESQACFSNAFLELLASPTTDQEMSLVAGGLKALCAQFLSEGVVSCFSLVPADDERLATAFVANGFRRTGVLQRHIVQGKERKDAILFSRKLANPLAD